MGRDVELLGWCLCRSNIHRGFCRFPNFKYKRWGCLFSTDWWFALFHTSPQHLSFGTPRRVNAHLYYCTTVTSENKQIEFKFKTYLYYSKLTSFIIIIVTEFPSVVAPDSVPTLFTGAALSRTRRIEDTPLKMHCKNTFNLNKKQVVVFFFSGFSVGVSNKTRRWIPGCGLGIPPTAQPLQNKQRQRCGEPCYAPAKTPRE